MKLQTGAKVSKNNPVKIAINAVTDLFSELIKNGAIKMIKEKQGGEVEPKDSKVNCYAEIIPSKLDFVVELEAELNESLLRNKELESQVERYKEIAEIIQREKRELQSLILDQEQPDSPKKSGLSQAEIFGLFDLKVTKGD